MAGSFWRDSNAWWIRAAARMAEGKMNNAYWKEANRRLWCLTWKVADCKGLAAHDRQDLVQHVMMHWLRPNSSRCCTRPRCPPITWPR